MMKFLDTTGLTYFWEQIKSFLDAKVPTTRKVNDKELSADITLGAEDLSYDNTTSGLTATTLQMAIDELVSDGTGSGGDADTLDGHDSSYFATTADLAKKVDKLDNMTNFPVNYGFAVARHGDTIGVSDGSDNYYMLVDSNRNFRVGTQLNGAADVTWTVLSKEGHTQAASTITAGTLGGQVVANATATAALSTSQIRNISLVAEASAPAEGSAATSAYAEGTVIFTY